MFLSIGIPIGTILFLSVIFIMYVIKKKYNDFQNRLFKFLLSFTFVLLFMEIGYVITMSMMDKHPFINELVSRLFIIGVIVWIVTFFFYAWSLGKKNISEEEKAKLESGIPIAIIIISTALAIINSFFKIKYYVKDGLYEIVGPATYILYIIAGVLIVFLLITLIMNRNDYPKNLKWPIYFSMILIVIDSALHLLIAEINDLTLLLSLVVSSLYFTIESQDRLLLKEVEDAKSKAEEINKAKTDFLSNMSHEIRTPMNTILGFSNSLLLDDDLTREKIMEDSKSINDASLNLLDLINNILDLSRIESNKETLNEKDYKIADMLLEINNVLKNKVKANNTYSLEIGENIPSGYYGDYAKALKIVESLIINAIKYTKDGNITVSLNHEVINDKDCLVYIITNTNSSMPKDYFNRDFSDFSKLDYSNDNKLDSAFLGLIIAKRLISFFSDSSIVFESASDDVTKCTICLCQKVTDKQPLSPDYLKESSDNEVIDCHDKKVLVVDDNEMNLKLAERLLKTYKFDISKASSGKECIEMIKKDEYDAIFLDHMMPDLDGIKTMHIIRSLNKKSTYIIAMTANSNIDSKDFYKKEGFDDYIGKPINKKRLDSLIDKLFGGKV